MKQRINTNCLQGMKCPKCASPGPFSLSTMCTMTWSDDGTEDDGGNMDFNPEGMGQCHECDYVGDLKEFDAEKRYVERGGSVCMYCDAEDEDLETDGPIQVDGANAWQDVRCNKCGGTWQDLFKLVGVGNYPDRDFVEEHNEESI